MTIREAATVDTVATVAAIIRHSRPRSTVATNQDIETVPLFTTAHLVQEGPIAPEEIEAISHAIMDTNTGVTWWLVNQPDRAAWPPVDVCGHAMTLDTTGDRIRAHLVSNSPAYRGQHRLPRHWRAYLHRRLLDAETMHHGLRLLRAAGIAVEPVSLSDGRWIITERSA